MPPLTARIGNIPCDKLVGRYAVLAQWEYLRWLNKHSGERPSETAAVLQHWVQWEGILGPWEFKFRPG